MGMEGLAILAVVAFTEERFFVGKSIARNVR